MGTEVIQTFLRFKPSLLENFLLVLVPEVTSFAETEEDFHVRWGTLRCFMAMAAESGPTSQIASNIDVN